MGRMEWEPNPLMQALGYEGPIYSDFYIPIPRRRILKEWEDALSLLGDDDRDEEEFAELRA
jgi:hypothetical protein